MRARGRKIKGRLVGGILIRLVAAGLAAVTMWFQVTVFWKNGQPIQDLSLNLIFAFSTFILGERVNSIGNLIIEESREDERDKQIQDLQDIYTSTVQVRKLGRPIDGIKHVIEAMNGDAIFIRDTVIRVQENNTYILNEVYEKYQETVDLFLKDGNKYVVVGNKHGLTLGEQFYAKHRTNQNFVMKIAELNFPFINFFIIIYKNKKEVLFGWDYDKSHTSSVFISEDEGIVDHFEGLYDCMLENSQDYKITSPEEQLNKAAITQQTQS